VSTMARRLPAHPFPVTTTMTTCALANYAIDPNVLATALPPGIEPAVLSGTGWLSIVLADMHRLRPAALPAWLGLSYRQIVYRALVDCNGERGVHFLRSDADSRVACAAGNALSLFRFHPAAITFTHRPDGLAVRVRSADGHGDLEIQARPADGHHQTHSISRLGDVEDVQGQLVEVFTAFDYDPHRRHHQVLRIDRGDWHVTAFDPDVATSAYMDAGPLFDTTTASLDSLVVARNLPYHWHRLSVRPAHATAAGHSA
jgi:uncharacterized protein YqjF (DUF2071 family)